MLAFLKVGWCIYRPRIRRVTRPASGIAPTRSPSEPKNAGSNHSQDSRTTNDRTRNPGLIGIDEDLDLFSSLSDAVGWVRDPDLEASAVEAEDSAVDIRCRWSPVWGGLVD